MTTEEKQLAVKHQVQILRDMKIITADDRRTCGNLLMRCKTMLEMEQQTHALKMGRESYEQFLTRMRSLKGRN